MGNFVEMKKLYLKAKPYDKNDRRWDVMKLLIETTPDVCNNDVESLMHCYKFREINNFHLFAGLEYILTKTAKIQTVCLGILFLTTNWSPCMLILLAIWVTAFLAFLASSFKYRAIMKKYFPARE